MSEPKAVKPEKLKEASKPEDVAAEPIVAAESDRSPLDTWLDNLPKQLVALVTADSSKERRHVAGSLIAELEALR